MKKFIILAGLLISSATILAVSQSIMDSIYAAIDRKNEPELRKLFLKHKRDTFKSAQRKALRKAGREARDKAHGKISLHRSGTDALHILLGSVGAYLGAAFSVVFVAEIGKPYAPATKVLALGLSGVSAGVCGYSLYRIYKGFISSYAQEQFKKARTIADLIEQKFDEEDNQKPAEA